MMNLSIWVRTSDNVKVNQIGAKLAKLPESLFYGLVFLLPWQTRYIFHDPPLFGGVWEYGRLSFYVWDIWLGILTIWLWPKLRPEFVLAFRQSMAFYIYLLLLSLVFLTGGWASEPLLVTYWGLRLLEGGLVWLLMRVIKPDIRKIFISLMLAGVLQALWGVWQFSSQSIAGNKWLGVADHPVAQGGTSVLLNEGGRWLRAYGGQVHPNVLGGLLVITSLATLWLALNARSVSGRYAAMAAYITQLVGLFVAFSRAAWLALLVSLLVGCFTWQYKRRAMLAMLGLTGFMFLILGAALWTPTKSRLLGDVASRLEYQAIAERVTGYKESQNLLAEAWWRGVGMGNYTAALADWQPGLRSYRYQPVHNIFMLVLTELGIVGLILWLLFWWQRLRQTPKELICLTCAVLATSLFDHYWWTSASMVVLFWLIMALPEAAPKGLLTGK